MKKILLSIAVCFGLVGSALAKEASGMMSSVKTEINQAERREVSRDQLPPAVKNVLASEQYAGAEFVNAFETTSAAGDGTIQVYEIRLRKGEDEIKLKLDSNGNNI